MGWWGRPEPTLVSQGLKGLLPDHTDIRTPSLVLPMQPHVALAGPLLLSQGQASILQFQVLEHLYVPLSLRLEENLSY